MSPISLARQNGIPGGQLHTGDRSEQSDAIAILWLLRIVLRDLRG